ncbi:Outer membrane protein/protective antigen OMA87 [Prochlorococcus marinus str. MIT 9321]|uniref:Outer membrane protein/protective antigen OMA87 n=1 Tax=Prochlorococcus marinus str. MIT 9401 TaxID=167551 RepID=A0A0A2BCD6_PROMR|nr:BamA/TamA family outer membrane protein [Prochlorococcus marinus]KGG02740.1 Outer membrane protein/protective antigen OMA87 [Prochlorococcus marinus str. MIT 9321]KGG05374.1 Outer membrane protein/protective antigen OMA87 [Prochlorococcus marinus str. MIT 9322]KGG10435.1 Outer membrane protein/protective antigen OMA87 [Prochlorococcus marinus str. MIT 9401]
MQKKFLKFRKVFTNIACSPLILISNNSELAAKYLPENLEQSINIFENKDISNNFFEDFDNKQAKNFLIAENKENLNQESVLISEIIIEGWENHPEGRKLELAAYDSMSIKPGSIVDNEILNRNLNAIYASGWFSGVKIRSQDGPLGVRLIVNVVPNPILKKVEIKPKNSVISSEYLDSIFNNFYGTTLNLKELQNKIQIIKKRYESEGYSLARISGPDRISESGIITLNVLEGIVSKIELRFPGSDGESIIDGKPRKGKTKDWVIKRELKTQPGTIFNRKILEADISRLYSTSLFDDVKVSLGPDNLNPGQVIIYLDLSEQRTGSLTGGLGYSNSSGIFASLGFQETNALGRAWSTNLNLNFGEYSTTYNFSLIDPWIKGDKHKTSFRTNLFLSRNYPQEFRSESNGKIYAVDDTNTSSSDTFSSIILEKTGGGFSFSRPLNGGDPFKVTKWKVLAGMNFKRVRMIDSSGNRKPHGDMTPTTGNISEIICIGYTPSDGSCPDENTLVSFVANTSRNNLNNPINPTAGNKLTLGSEQFIPLGENSPTFNRMSASYAIFIPTRLVNLTKGCRSGDLSNNDCPQAIGFQLKGGTIIGELPPYEAFCMGGTSSVRGWSSCDLAVSKTFVEGTAEYRFPVWRMISGALFADAGSDLGSQDDVPGKPGKLLKKSGSGFSLGGGIGVKTPIGPLRLDVASKDLSGEWRYTLGVGWKF